MPTPGYDIWKRSGPDDEVLSGYMCEHCDDHLLAETQAVLSVIGELFHPECWEDFRASVNDLVKESDQRYWEDRIVEMIRGGYI